MQELEQLAALAETDDDLAYVQGLLENHERSGRGEGLPSRFVTTLGEVAKVVGVELGTVRDWRTGADPMPGEEGRFDLVEILLWRCRRLKANAANAKPPEQLEIELDILRADRTKKQIANEIKAGNLREIEPIRDGVYSFANEARMGFEGLAADLAPLFPPEIRNELMLKVNQAVALHLRKMAQKVSTCLE